MNGDLVHQKVSCVFMSAVVKHHDCIIIHYALWLFHILSSPIIPSSPSININMLAHKYSLKILFEKTQN